MVEVGTSYCGWSGAQPAGQCLPLLICPSTIKSRSSLFGTGSPRWSWKKGRKMVVVWLWWYQDVWHSRWICQHCWHQVSHSYCLNQRLQNRAPFVLNQFSVSVLESIWLCMILRYDPCKNRLQLIERWNYIHVTCDKCWLFEFIVKTWSQSGEMYIYSTVWGSFLWIQMY